MKKLLLALLILVCLIVLSYFVADYLVHKKIDHFLNEQVKEGKLDYDQYTLNLFHGDFSISKLKFLNDNSSYSANEVHLIGFSFYQYLLHKKIKFDSLYVEKPVLDIKRPSKKKEEKQSSKDKKGFDKSVQIGSISIMHGNLSLQKDSVEKLNVQDYTVHLDSVVSNSQTRQQRTPFTYSTYAIQSGKITYDMNNLERIKLDSLNISQKNILLLKLHITPKYSKKDYIKVIPYEKDLISLKIDTIQIKDYKLDLNAKKIRFSTPEVIFAAVDFDDYRDKTVNDDPRNKKMYSQMLRDLPFELNIDSMIVRRAKISYKERQESTGEVGEVFLSDLSANISNITNVNMLRDDFPETKIDVSCHFMGTSPLKVNWGFKVNDSEDHFTIKGSSFNIQPKLLNPFLMAVLNVKATGNIDKVFFNFYGNKNSANGDFKMQFKNFNVQVMKKDGKEKNGFLSFVYNIFVHKKASGEYTHDVKDVERDHKKSFWNYFCNCLFQGLRKSFL